MKASQVAKTLDVMIKAKQPVFIWGPPGAGKSDTVKQAAKRYGGKMIDLRLPNFDAVDMRGIPAVIDGETVWMTPKTFPKNGKGVIFLDELPQAPQIVQAAASQLILDRRMGDYVLPDGWVVIAAGNRDTDRAATNRMPTHIANRFTHIDFEVDAADWITWAMANNINPMVIAFIAFRPELLHKFDPAKRDEKAFPTPRTWAFVSNLLDQNIDDCMLDVIAGTVGMGAATEFIGFVRVFREMPSLDEIKAAPEKLKIPENVAARYAISTMLSRMTQPGDMAAVTKYVSRMSKEFQILIMNDVTKHNRKLAETSAYIGWAAKNKDDLLNATAR
jgi:hypothetical protein